MNVFILGLYIASITLYLSLALIVIVRNPTSAINRTFALFTISVLLWVVFLYLYYTSESQTLVDISGRLEFTLGVAVVHSLFLFCYFFPCNDRLIAKKWHVVLAAISAVLMPLCQFTGYIDVAEHIDGPLRRSNQYGILSPLYLGHLLLLSAAAIWVLYKKYSNSSGIEKLQIKYLVFSASVGLIFSLSASIGLPFFLHKQGLELFSLLGPDFMLLVVTLAIIQHRLFDIRLIVRATIFRVLTYLIIAALLIFQLRVFHSLFPQLDFLVAGTIYICFALVEILLVLQPITKVVSLTGNRTLFRREFEREQLLQDFLREGSVMLDKDQLVSYIMTTVQHISLTKHVTFIIKAPEGSGSYIYFLNEWFPFADSDVQLIFTYFGASPSTLVADELLVLKTQASNPIQEAHIGQLSTLMAAHDCALIVPLISRNSILGLMALAPKSPQEPYTGTDIAVLETLSYPLATELQNAYLIDEQKKSNATLEERVKQKTEEIERSQQELRKQYELVKSLDDLKTELISVEAHEYRTPITIINNYAALIEKLATALNNVQLLEHARKIRSQADRLLSITNNVLTASQLEAGNLILHPDLCDLAQLIADLKKSYEPRIQEKNLSLTMHFSNDVTQATPTVFCMADKERIRLVIDNLLSNAVKFTPQGGKIEVSVTMVAGRIRLVVADTGEGIEEHRLPYIFDRYAKRQNIYHSSSEPGVGVGLYIAKGIVGLHQGTIAVASQVGKGTIFTVDLPQNIQLAEATKPGIVEIKLGEATTQYPDKIAQWIRPDEPKVTVPVQAK